MAKKHKFKAKCRKSGRWPKKTKKVKVIDTANGPREVDEDADVERDFEAIMADNGGEDWCDAPMWDEIDIQLLCDRKSGHTGPHRTIQMIPERCLYEWTDLDYDKFLAKRPKLRNKLSKEDESTPWNK